MQSGKRYELPQSQHASTHTTHDTRGGPAERKLHRITLDHSDSSHISSHIFYTEHTRIINTNFYLIQHPVNSP